MSLIGALHTGFSGLAVNQAALEVVGNNMANSATKGYSRQSAVIVASTGTEVQPGTFIGNGIQLQTIIRHVDEALNTRLRSATSDQQAATARQDVLTQIESIENDLSDQGISNQLTQFANSWSQLASNPTDPGLRTLVVSQGQSLAELIGTVRGEMSSLRKQTETDITANVTQADQILTQIASINQQITLAEGGAGSANALRDQRDQLLSQLSELVPVTTVLQPSGSMDVLVDSIPIVLGTQSRGLQVTPTNESGTLQYILRVKADGSRLDPQSGKIGQLMESRVGDVTDAINALDTFAGNLIFQLNKVHSSGQGEQGYGTLTASNGVLDATAALNTPAAGLTFQPVNGSFQITVTQKSTGQKITRQINVDLDGIGTDTSLNDIAGALSAVPNLTATVAANGKLKIDAASSDFTFSFSQDSSAALAALGLNSFFNGTSAADISVNSALTANPLLLAAGQGDIAGDNRNALQLAGLFETPLDDLNGQTLRGSWENHVQDFAARTDSTKRLVQSTGIVTDGLSAQQQSVSGVNLDEEAVNLLSFQRSYQGSARFISVVDEMLQTVLGLVK